MQRKKQPLLCNSFPCLTGNSLLPNTDGHMYKADSSEVTFGLNESLENRDAPEAQIEVPSSASTPSGKRKRKTTSQVWSNFELLPLAEDGKKRCKRVKCCVVYLCDSSYGTHSLRRHVLNCSRRDTRNVGQLLFSKSRGSIVTRSSKIDVKKFCELLVVS